MKFFSFILLAFSLESSASFRPKFIESVSASKLDVAIEESSLTCDVDEVLIKITGYEGWNEVGPLVYIEVLEKTSNLTLFSAQDNVPGSIRFCAEKSNLNNVTVNWFHGTGGDNYRLRTLKSLKP